MSFCTRRIITDLSLNLDGTALARVVLQNDKVHPDGVNVGAAARDAYYYDKSN